ncbi:flagellar biosynthetic protein FliO [Hyphomicrobium sulfonivorans]|uniref:flagellar biosynthetic protein FliO n=1 Tax=Hyphomicrobium sulfonivorans TaxID=121290 RepID=UPI0015713C0D|nr:flagellar biosynthetic protein FliO [Hyphomicrobium sulfonivorans]MBI1650399.1 flagellar biosynthetic protein FliO [Hyphomicrobium sulfonivorans]NSL72240.1 hypothetical protein [Hyphomicrobium sulfonivorans]
MTELLLRVLAFALLAAGVVAAAWVVRKTRNPRFSALFAAKPTRRIEIVEQAIVDPKRRLILIRRDGIEHLIMTGGPVDIVIESGIDGPQPGSSSLAIERASQSTRPPHLLGEAAE